MSALRTEDRAMVPSMLASDDCAPVRRYPEMHGGDDAGAADLSSRTLRPGR